MEIIGLIGDLWRKASRVDNVRERSVRRDAKKDNFSRFRLLHNKSRENCPHTKYISITILNRVVAIAADDVNDSYVQGSRKAESTSFESSPIQTTVDRDDSRHFSVL